MVEVKLLLDRENPKEGTLHKLIEKACKEKRLSHERLAVDAIHWMYCKMRRATVVHVDAETVSMYVSSSETAGFLAFGDAADLLRAIQRTQNIGGRESERSAFKSALANYIHQKLRVELE